MPNKDKLKVGKHMGLMVLINKSIRDKLKRYADDPRIKGREDAYVREQLEERGKQKYWYPGVSKDITRGILGTEQTYFDNPNYQKWLNDPKNVDLKNEQNKKHGELYSTKFSNLTPDQQQLQTDITKAAQNTIPGIYENLGKPTSLEQPTNDMIMNLINQMNQGKGMGAEHLSGFGAFPGLKENLSALGSGAQQLGQGAYNVGSELGRKGQMLGQAAYPYAQKAAAKGQSYLSAAQPYAQKAADLGSDIFNAIRAPAVSAAGQVRQDGLGSLLNILRGRA